MHRRSDKERVDFFLVYQLGGETLGTPRPRSALSSCGQRSQKLPNDTIPYVRAAIQNFAKGQLLREFGWEYGQN